MNIFDRCKSVKRLLLLPYFLCIPLPQHNAIPKKLLFYQANNPSMNSMLHHTQTYIKNGNLTPVARLCVKNGEQALRISYTGTSGKAQSTFIFNKAFRKLYKQHGSIVNGIFLDIFYEQADFMRISLEIWFFDKSKLVNKLVLEKGRKLYFINKGFRRANFPIDWSKIAMISICSDGTGEVNKDFCFFLYSASLSLCANPDKTQKTSTSAVKIHNFTVRDAVELTETDCNVKIDGEINKVEWQNAVELNSFHAYKGSLDPDVTSPVKAKLLRNNTTLFVAVEAVFPNMPLAIVKDRDGPVFQDESIELFFNGNNKHNELEQFVINRNGVVFDQKRAYDKVAVSIKNNKDWALKDYTHASLYKNGVLFTEISLPLDNIEDNLHLRKYIGFQICQNYNKQKDKRLQKSLSWQKTDRFPNAYNFGILVFNKKSFGTGKLTATSIEKKGLGDQKCDFGLTVKFNGVPAGEYTIEKKIVAADDSVFEASESIILNTSTLEKTFFLRNIKNRTGRYSFYVSLINPHGDRLLLPVNFQNSVKSPDLYGKLIFQPRVKKIRKRGGEFKPARMRKLYIDREATKRTYKTARLFCEKYYGFTGTKLLIEQTDFPAKKQDGIILRLFKGKVSFNNEKIPLKEQGYFIHIESNKVLLVGYDEPGLFYACTTFFQALNYKADPCINRAIPCLEIVDWPDMLKRNVRFDIQWQNWRQPVYDEIKIERLMDFTENYFIGNKFNILILDASALVKYTKHTRLNNPNPPFSLEDMRRFSDFCRDRFMEVGLKWEIGGHAGYWMLRQFPELVDPGYSKTSDVSHPDHDRIVFESMAEVVDAMKPEYLCPAGDEWWGHQKKNVELKKVLPSGRTRAQAFVDFQIRFNQWCKKRGMKMLLYHDMLTPFHNGKRQNLYKEVEKRLPRDITILAWADYGINDLINKGFSVWYNATALEELTSDVKNKLSGYGVSIYGYDTKTWLYQHSDHNWQKLPQVFRGADIAWNIYRDKNGTWQDEMENGRIPGLYSIFSQRANPFAGERIHNVALGKYLNSSFSAFIQATAHQKCGSSKANTVFPMGKRIIAGLPTLFSRKKDKNCIILKRRSEPVKILLNKNFSSLLFLHSAYIDRSYAKKIGAKFWRNYPYGYHTGKYVITYSDGSRLTIQNRLDKNINFLNTVLWERYAYDCRYVYCVKTDNGTDICLYQYEWVNPFPDKTIQSIEMIAEDKLDIDLLLFALSGREVIVR